MLLLSKKDMLASPDRLLIVGVSLLQAIPLLASRVLCVSKNVDLTEIFDHGIIDRTVRCACIQNVGKTSFPDVGGFACARIASLVESHGSGGPNTKSIFFGRILW